MLDKQRTVQRATLTAAGVGLISMFVLDVVPEWVKHLGFYTGVALVLFSAWGWMYPRKWEALMTRLEFWKAEEAEGFLPFTTNFDAVWNSAQAVAWIATRDDSNIDLVNTVEITSQGAGYDVREAAHILALKRQLNLSDETTMDDAAEAIQKAALKGEIKAIGRKARGSVTTVIEASEWQGHKINPYIGRIFHESDIHLTNALWIDVTFREAEIKSRWPREGSSA